MDYSFDFFDQNGSIEFPEGDWGKVHDLQDYNSEEIFLGNPS